MNRQAEHQHDEQKPRGQCSYLLLGSSQIDELSTDSIDRSTKISYGRTKTVPPRPINSVRLRGGD